MSAEDPDSCAVGTVNFTGHMVVMSTVNCTVLAVVTRCGYAVCLRGQHVGGTDNWCRDNFLAHSCPRGEASFCLGSCSSEIVEFLVCLTVVDIFAKREPQGGYPLRRSLDG
jgi:hypothetical protein